MEPTEVLQALRSQNSRNANSGQRPPRPWYSVRNLATGEAEIFIYDMIGFDPFFGGVGAADFVRELRAINAQKILLRINSPGGDISEAVTIRNALIEHPAQIETHVDGLAASSASWVGLAAEKVIMSPHAMMMIHEPFYIVGGDAAYLRQQADILDKFAVDIATMYQEKGGGTVDEWRALMREETWYSDQEAVAAGLADEVATQEAPAAPAGNRYDPGILAIFKHTPSHLMNNTPAPAGVHDPMTGTHAHYHPAYGAQGGDDWHTHDHAHNNNAGHDHEHAAPADAKAQPDPELVRSALIYQRDQSRRQGVAA